MTIFFQRVDNEDDDEDDDDRDDHDDHDRQSPVKKEEVVVALLHLEPVRHGHQCLEAPPEDYRGGRDLSPLHQGAGCGAGEGVRDPARPQEEV